MKPGDQYEATGCSFSVNGNGIVSTQLSDHVYVFDTNKNYEKEYHVNYKEKTQPIKKRVRRHHNAEEEEEDEDDEETDEASRRRRRLLRDLNSIFNLLNLLYKPTNMFILLILVVKLSKDVDSLEVIPNMSLLAVTMQEFTSTIKSVPSYYEFSKTMKDA